jgi:integrase
VAARTTTSSYFRRGTAAPGATGRGSRHRDVWRPVTAALGIQGSRPYDLRHSFASLLIQEGVQIIEVARQLGHSPTMTLEVYAHVFDEFDPAERMSAEEAIRTARDEVGARTGAGLLLDAR